MLVRLNLIALFISLGALAMGCSTTMQGKMTQRSSGKDIVDIALSSGSFRTLVKAVKVAGLVGTLKGSGPFTVFAPTDAAFAKVPKATLSALLKDKKKLAAVLTYHVVPGKVTSRDVAGVRSAKTVNGQKLSINVDGGKVMIDNARVVKADIMAKNGVIHVIDSVVLPKKL